MPQYVYQCAEGHEATKLRKWEAMDEPLECECGEPMTRIWSTAHVGPDGMYSYAPNVGDMNSFDRKMNKIEINKARKKDGLKPGFEETS